VGGKGLPMIDQHLAVVQGLLMLSIVGLIIVSLIPEQR
jgi:hypothetical protein